MIRYAICLLAVPLLAACNDDPAPTVVGEDSRDATGDVLEGSISDDMLPLDSLQSTSPAAVETADASGGSAPRSSAPVAREPTAPAPAESAEPLPAEELVTRVPEPAPEPDSE